MLIENEKDKKQLNLKDARALENKEKELEMKERNIDDKLNTIQTEFDKLYLLRNENLKIK